MYNLVLKQKLPIKYVALAIDPFLGPCHSPLLGVVCDVISDAAVEEEGAIGWMFHPQRAWLARPLRMETSIQWLPLPRQQHR